MSMLDEVIALLQHSVVSDVASKFMEHELSSYLTKRLRYHQTLCAFSGSQVLMHTAQVLRFLLSA